MAKLVLDKTPQPGWPEFGHLTAEDPTELGPRFRLADAPSMSDGDLLTAYYVNEDGGRVYPWKNAGYYEDARGKPIVPRGFADVPMMSRDKLQSLGFDDEKLAAEYRRMIGELPAGPELRSGTTDSLELKALRRRVFDACAARWYVPSE